MRARPPVERRSRASFPSTDFSSAAGSQPLHRSPRRGRNTSWGTSPFAHSKEGGSRRERKRSEPRGASLMRNALSISFMVALGLLVAASAGAVTITSWVGGKAAVPQIVTAAGTCPGTVITINGSGFVSDGGITNVTIGGVPAGEITIGSDSVLFARVGAGAQNGSVVGHAPSSGRPPRPTPAIVYPCQATAVATEKPAIRLGLAPEGEERKEAHADRKRVRRHDFGEGRHGNRLVRDPVGQPDVRDRAGGRESGLDDDRSSRPTREPPRSCSRRPGDRRSTH